MDNKQKQTEEMKSGALLVAWNFSEKEKPFVSIFTKKNDHLYVEHISNKDEGYLVLGGYRKQSDTAREILDEVSRHFGGAWLVELYKKYGVEV